MTLKEVNDRFPNGFHDAEVSALEINYATKTAKLFLSLWVGSMDDPHPQRETYQNAVVNLMGLYFCSIDPPDVTYPFIPDGTGVVVDGGPATPDIFPSLAALMAKLPAGAWCYRFFVSDWNSFIHIAAQNADIALIGEKKCTHIANLARLLTVLSFLALRILC